jgi:hypothetical protein
MREYSLALRLVCGGVALIVMTNPALAEQKYIECNTVVISVNNHTPPAKIQKTIGFYIDDRKKLVRDINDTVLATKEFDDRFIKILVPSPAAELTIDRRTGDLDSYIESDDGNFRQTTQGKCAEAPPPTWQNKF